MGFPNERRGLKIVGTDYTYLTEGSAGWIFVNDTKTRIRKLFHPVHYDLSHARKVFDAEVAAYEIAISSEAVRPYVAEFFGVVPSQPVIDREGNDVAAELFDGLVFEAEYIPGDFDKLSRALTHGERNLLVPLFHSVGILDIEDASATHQDDGSIKIVDFSTKLIRLSWD